MIEYVLKKVKPFSDDREIIAFEILSPFEDLSIIQGISNIEDLDYFIEWLEELKHRNIPDYSELGAILYQGILWGSVKSKIVDLLDNGQYIEKQEFSTNDLIKLCMEWKKFIEIEK